MYPVLGIDVSKAKIDVALCVSASAVTTATFSNSASGFAGLDKWVNRQTEQPLHACLEATGRYGDAVASHLYAQDHIVSVVNPSRIHAYGRSKLRRSKTDKCDALLIADFCATQELAPWRPLSMQQLELQELTRQLEDLKKSRQRVSNRLGSGIRSTTVQRLLGEQLELLAGQIQELEAEIAECTHQDEQQKAQFKLLTSIPGIGPCTATKFLAEVPDFRQFDSADQLAAYAGLVPKQHFSGSSVHKKSTLAKTGNSFLRTAFYMPALSAARFNPLIAIFSKRLEERGKAKMTVVAAVMHKLLVLAYGVLKSGRPFDLNFALSHQIAT